MMKEINTFLDRFEDQDTKRTYRCILNGLSREVNKPLKKITTQDVRKYFMKIIKKHGNRSRTTVSYKSILRNFFEKNGREDLKKILDEFIIRMPARKPLFSRGKILEEDEYKKLLESVDFFRDEIILRVLWTTGCRVNELVNILVKDINFRERIILVHGKGKRGSGPRDRIIPTTEKTLKSIEKYIKENNLKNKDFLIGIKKITVQKMLIRLGNDAGLKRNITPHMFRHSCLTRWGNSKMPLLTMSAMAGHDDLETLRKVYYHTSPTIMRCEYDKIKVVE